MKRRRLAVQLFAAGVVLSAVLLITRSCSRTHEGEPPESGLERETKKEISRMAESFGGARRSYNDLSHFPSKLVLFKDAYRYKLPPPAPPAPQVTQAEVNSSLDALNHMFGKRWLLKATAPNQPSNYIAWNGNLQTMPDMVVLEGQHCLVFYLGGIPSPVGSPTTVLGFSKNPLDPSLAGGTERIGPFYPFKTTRLARDTTTAGQAGFFVYLDAFGRKAQPYAFFGTTEASNRDIISTAKDRKFGRGDTPPADRER